MLADTQDKFQLAQYRFVLGVATAIVHLCELMTSGKAANRVCTQQSVYTQLVYIQDMQLHMGKAYCVTIFTFTMLSLTDSAFGAHLALSLVRYAPSTRLGSLVYYQASR